MRDWESAWIEGHTLEVVRVGTGEVVGDGRNLRVLEDSLGWRCDQQRSKKSSSGVMASPSGRYGYFRRVPPLRWLAWAPA